MSNTAIDLRPADSRFHTDIGWLDSWHSFSFGGHFDAGNIGHGLLIVSNDDRVAPAGGFGTHGHRDMEIVTWVLDGELEHRDSTGTFGVIYPGLAQRMSAGSGIQHSEMNHSATEPVHFVQMWVVPDTSGIAPGYEQLDVNERLAEGGLVPVASGRGHDGAIKIHQRGAVMWVGRLADGERVTLPDAPFVHVFAARGTVRFGDTLLAAGDAARLTDAGPLELTADGSAEVIVWESDASAQR
jgi:redox-sensitive bicupin YhaK (pirin superfamily)